jgi:hypothetical protein
VPLTLSGAENLSASGLSAPIRRESLTGTEFLCHVPGLVGQLFLNGNKLLRFSYAERYRRRAIDAQQQASQAIDKNVRDAFEGSPAIGSILPSRLNGSPRRSLLTRPEMQRQQHIQANADGEHRAIRIALHPLVLVGSRLRGVVALIIDVSASIRIADVRPPGSSNVDFMTCPNYPHCQTALCRRCLRTEPDALASLVTKTMAA